MVTKTRLRSLAARLRPFPRDPVAWLFAISLFGLGTLYFVNRDGYGQLEKPRGDGVYRPVLARGDGHMMFLMLRSLVLDGDLQFDNDLRRFGDPWRQPATATGRRDIPHPIGPPLVWAPVFALVHAASKVVNVFGGDVASHGYTLFHQRALYLTSVLFAFGAVLLGWLVARRWIGGRWAPAYAAVAILWGTSLTYYGTYMPSYGHAMDAAAVGGFLAVWALGFGDLRWRRFVAMGVLLGVAALIRVQDFAFGVVVALEVVVLALRPAPEGVPRARHAAALFARGAVTLAVAIAVFTPQLVVWKLMYGDPFHQPNGPRYVRLEHPQILELLFSSRNGWFSTTPLAYAAVVGLVFVPRGARVVVGGLALALATQVYLNACILDWWAQASYGNRRLCSVTAILVVGLAALLRAGGRAAARLRVPAWGRHAAAAVALGWFMWWNVGWVHELRGGKAAGRDVGPLSWKGVPTPLLAIARPIYDRIGNPFTFPANVWFAARHGVPVRRWERIAGAYVWVPPVNAYNDGSYRRHENRWAIASAAGDAWIVGGFGQHERDGARDRRVVTGSPAKALVPLLLPEAHRFTLPVAPATPGTTARVRVRVNGAVVAERDVGAWTDLTFDVPADGLRVGENVLAVEAAPGTLAISNLIVGFPP